MGNRLNYLNAEDNDGFGEDIFNTFKAIEVYADDIRNYVEALDNKVALIQKIVESMYNKQKGYSEDNITEHEVNGEKVLGFKTR